MQPCKKLTRASDKPMSSPPFNIPLIISNRKFFFLTERNSSTHSCVIMANFYAYKYQISSMYFVWIPHLS
ncbi:hypothetical protein SORBI_3010G163666 [Sorghum bicolor]|uniref:Uncharacterized protein n=1 Tax=Sorghum bicolor TaxID=4558 RepID=A0A1W0VTD5_SORBI|nr:hypothetical protein SORBI_3010G163666 [Sorghum bicolor]